MGGEWGYYFFFSFWGVCPVLHLCIVRPPPSLPLVLSRRQDVFYGRCEAPSPWKRSVSLRHHVFCPLFPGTQPLLPTGCERLESFRLKVPVTCAARNLNQTVCLCAAGKNFCFLSDVRTPSILLLLLLLTGPPLCPSSSASFTEYDSLSPLLSPPLDSFKIVLKQSLHHITDSLWMQPHRRSFIFLIFLVF